MPDAASSGLREREQPALPKEVTACIGQAYLVVRVSISENVRKFFRLDQPHEVQAQNPKLQGLVMAGEDGPGEIVEAALAGVAVVALPLRWRVIPTIFDDVLMKSEFNMLLILWYNSRFVPPFDAARPRYPREARPDQRVAAP